jgi:CRP-like cAMP-binding protein
MSSQVVESLRKVHIFADLTDSELLQLAGLCKVWRTSVGQPVFQEGEDGHELYIIQEGCVRVSIQTRRQDGSISPGTINMLYAGQSFGEMVLLDWVTRSATVVSVEPCVLLVIKQQDFDALCESNPRIGYRVMHNLACDVAYKLRSSNLLLRGQIRWQQDELGKRS